MMPIKPNFDATWLEKLLQSTHFESQGSLNGHPYRASIVIPYLSNKITSFYQDILKGGLASFCSKVEVPYCFDHFGLVIAFSSPVELILHNDVMEIDDGLRVLSETIGPVIFKNAYLEKTSRNLGHRNRFPHLNFHVDRSVGQSEIYSMYTRNPFDEEQQNPRPSSTLFIPNIVGYLQALKEGQIDLNHDKGIRPTYTIFSNENMEDIRDILCVEHAWNEAKGIGEISMLDNRTLLHASYYRGINRNSYKIGVRYLA